MGRLTLTTWNLQGSRGVDVDQVAAHVREAGTDLLALQEVQRAQAAALAQALAAQTVGWGFKHWPLNTWPEGMALLGITMAIEAVETRPVTRRRQVTSWRRRIVQTATVALARRTPAGTRARLRRIHLVNVHLTPHRDGAADRDRELHSILPNGGAAPGAARASRQPTVVLGDLNSEPGTAPYEQMRSAGYTPAGSGPTYWRGEPSNRPPEREIDYIWVPESLTIESTHRPRHGDPDFDRFWKISDHVPVTATLATK